MTPDELKAALECLALSQSGASRILGINPRTMRRWVSGEQDVPGIAVAFLGLLEACPPALKLAKKLAATALQAGAQEPEDDAAGQSPQPDQPA